MSTQQNSEHRRPILIEVDDATAEQRGDGCPTIVAPIGGDMRTIPVVGTVGAATGRVEVADDKPIPGYWNREMAKLADYLRSKGKYIPEGCTVDLERVPEHLRDENGKPMYKVVIVEGGAG